MVGASAVGGFALSQWLTENERAAHGTIEHELRERVEEARRSESQLEITRASERAEVEKGVLNKLGIDGVAVMTMVGPCRPALVVSAPGTTSPPGVTAETATPPPTPSCTETEASYRDAMRDDPYQRDHIRSSALRPTDGFGNALE